MPPPEKELTGDPAIDFAGYKTGPLAGESPSIFSSPQGFYGPGILSNTGALLGQKLFGSTETPEQVYKATTPLQETAANLATALLPPAGGFLGRMAVQGATQGGLSQLGGKSIEQSLKDAG